MRTPTQHRRCRRSGFTLPEIMVSMGILMVGVMSTFGLMEWIVRGTDQSGRTTRALLSAQDKLESLVSSAWYFQSSYDALTSGSDVTNGITRVWTVTPHTGYKEISLITRWTLSTGAQRAMTNATILAEP